MLKPERMLIGTSENLLKGVISLSILSYSLGIKGVITVSRSEDEVTLLGSMGGGATQGA